MMQQYVLADTQETRSWSSARSRALERRKRLIMHPVEIRQDGPAGVQLFQNLHITPHATGITIRCSCAVPRRLRQQITKHATTHEQYLVV